MRITCSIVVVGTAFMALSAVVEAADSRFDFGVLACVSELTRNSPSLPHGARSDEIKMYMRSSAFVLGDPAGGDRVFLVTAAHNLCDCDAITVRNELSLVDVYQSNGELKPFCYFDQAEDLAVFEWSKSQADSFRQNDSRRKTKQRSTTLGRVVAELVKPVDRVERRLPRGGVAAAAGTVSESGSAAAYPAYSCTISRYATGSELYAALNKQYRDAASDRSANDPVSAFRRNVVNRIGGQQFLVVESMSITVGFSGSPIMISDDHYYDKGDVVGIVIGGKPADRAGRSAWAVVPDTIARAIEYLKLANDGTPPKWTPVVQSGDEAVVLEDPTEAGRLISKISAIVELKSNHAEKFASPFLNRYSSESRVEFDAPFDGYELCRTKFLELTKNLPGKSFTFRRFAFNESCLDEITLLTPRFEFCEFRSTRFRGAVLSGPVFSGCRLFSNSQEMDIRLIVSQPCNSTAAICSPAAIVAASFRDPEDREIVGSFAPIPQASPTPR